MSLDSYRQRFAFCQRQICLKPPTDLGIALVIPCCGEPDLIATLESLWACHVPRGGVEVLVVVNSVENGDPSIREQNRMTIQQAGEWASRNPHPKFTLHLLDFPHLPRKQGGVGLARKIGMDEAALRFDDLSRLGDGVIAGFDADCTCDPNYLVSLEEHFGQHPQTPGCSVYFEHPLQGRLAPAVYEAILHYELHLRYYVQALRFVGFPYAFHAVGSAMAVRAETYIKQGGMNRRQAGEDFYFLQKVIGLGGFTDLVETRVIPSPRPSHRVPFGTGRAVEVFLTTGKLQTYPLEAFLSLKALFHSMPSFYNASLTAQSETLAQLDPTLQAFLRQEEFDLALNEIRQNTASFESFRRRFFAWCNGFQVMKYIHFYRDHSTGLQPVGQESLKLLAALSLAVPPEMPLPDILDRFRRLDRSQAF